MEEQLNMMRRGRQFKQLMNKKMDGIIREYDVKRVEIEILRFLAMSGERNTAADIHRYLDLNKGQISKTLEHLCTMHYLESISRMSISKSRTVPPASAWIFLKTVRWISLLPTIRILE